MIMDAIVYTGTNYDIDTNDNLEVSGAVIKSLLSEKYLALGHILYTDNWYTNPSLSMFWHKNNTGSGDTVRKNHKGMLKNSSKLQKGNMNYWKYSPLLSVRWEHKREVFLIKTLHKGHMLKKDENYW